MVGHAEQLDRRWTEGSVVEIRGEMRRLTLKMTADVLFDDCLEAQADELSPALAVLLRAIPRLPVPWPGVIAARRRVEHTARKLNGGTLLPRLREAGLTDAQVVDEVIAYLISSIDTTPETLVWAWFLIGRDEPVRARIQEELAAVLAGRTPTHEDLPRLTYLNQVISEVLRLYPAVHYIDRRPLADVELNGVAVPANSYMLLSPLITHRDPRYFEDPKAFRPDRWDPDAIKSHPRSAYFPFGAGLHGCIGEGLARMEIALTLATLAQRWNLRPSPELPELPGPYTREVPMILERRR